MLPDLARAAADAVLPLPERVTQNPAQVAARTDNVPGQMVDVDPADACHLVDGHPTIKVTA